MSIKIELLTTQSSLDELYTAADGQKASVRISRQALLHLLMDHSIMAAALRDRGVNVTGPVKRERLRLGRAGR